MYNIDGDFNDRETLDGSPDTIRSKFSADTPAAVTTTVSFGLQKNALCLVRVAGTYRVPLLFFGTSNTTVGGHVKRILPDLYIELYKYIYQYNKYIRVPI